MTIKEQDFQDIWKNIYPIGSYYFSNNATSPQSIFGGNWEQVNGYFLYPSNSGTDTGGRSTASLSSSCLKSHSHSYSHSHSGYSHYHNTSGSNHTHHIPIHYHSFSINQHTHSKAGDVANVQWLLQTKKVLAPSVTRTTGYVHTWQTAATGQSAHAKWIDTARAETDETSTTTQNSNLGTSTESSGTGNSSLSGDGQSQNASVTVTESAGNGSSFSIMPTYKGYYVWYRTG